MTAARLKALYFGWADAAVSQEVEAIIASRCELVYAHGYRFGEAADQERLATFRPDVIFSFGPLILRGPLLRSAKLGAINFHTAPPKWPGRGSCSFALLNGDTSFGVTAHYMTEAVDAGPILKVHRFPIEPEDTAETLRLRAFAAIPLLVRETVDDLTVGRLRPVTNAEWNGPARRQTDLVREMEITCRDSIEVVERKIRAFRHKAKPGPFVTIHGHRFWFLADK